MLHYIHQLACMPAGFAASQVAYVAFCAKKSLAVVAKNISGESCESELKSTK